MAPASVRYFGVKLADVDLAGARSDAALGRFVPMADPLPVGTVIEVDDVAHRVTRVDEGLAPGVWLWTDGVVRQPAPDAVTAPEMATVRDLAVHAEGVPEPVDAQATVPTPMPVAAEAEPAPAPVAPDKSDKNDKGEDGGKRRRRRAKTTVGR